jgi:hypothetical protein
MEIPDSTPDRFPAQLFLENDFFRAVSEIYRLKFEYGNTLKPDLEILWLHSQYRLHEYYKVMQNSKKLLDREEIQSVVTQRFEIGKLLTASLIQTGRPDEAGQVWQYHCYPVTGEEFPTADNLPDRIDPEKARLYSAVLPGSGFILSGEYNKAIVSFLLNALFIAGIYQYAADNQYGIAGVLVFFELGWYFGGQNASYEAAEKVNFKKIQQARQDWIDKKLN